MPFQAVGSWHLVNARREELHDGEVLARPLHGLPHGPVVERPLHLDMIATVTPCSVHDPSMGLRTIAALHRAAQALVNVCFAPYNMAHHCVWTMHKAW